VCLLPWPHAIHCKVVCEPVLRRYVAAPFDSRLLRSHVVVGQKVSQGELLATLDGGELRSQLASIRAKLAQAEQRELAALSTGDHSKSEFERLEVEHLRREAELLERRQANLEIRSPIDGVVVTGDLERAEGAPLAVGDNLFEIASLNHLIAEVAVPENEILFIKNDLPVSIILDAIPGSRLESTVHRIHLRSEIRDNASVFIAEAELPNDDALLRPGMNANATIHAGYRAIGWQLFRRPFNAARQWIGW
jgi:multidrug resistance efflux pump